MERKKFAFFYPYGGGPGNKKDLGMGLGDRIERIVKPVAMALKSKCIDPETRKLIANTPCHKRKELLNKLGEKIGIGTSQVAQDAPKT